MSQNNKHACIEPRTLQGFMELSPQSQALFNEITDTIRNGFERFGFLPLDTPVLEYAAVLLAKAGGETEKQIYRFTKGDTDMCMRFDLTVPLAKYVASKYHELAFPFRRYQIGKVYRGERPQKGRFREFYQCDIDVVGDGRLDIMTDAEMPAVIWTVFRALGFEKFTIYISNRKILSGFLESLSLSGYAADILCVVDKLKKIGVEKTRAELTALSLPDSAVNSILEFIALDGTADAQLAKLSALHVDSELYQAGVRELAEVVKGIRLFGVSEENFALDLKIVRGLDYYTGTVYETFLEGHENIGSVCSGGRYDDLAGFYTDKKLPGVGISIGLTRLFDKLSDVIAKKQTSVARVLVLSPDGQTDACLSAAAQFRARGINTQVYFEDGKAKTKFRYADRLSIPFVAIIGETERQEGKLTLKNMQSGEQFDLITIEKAVKILG